MIVIAKAQGLNRVIQFNPQRIKIKTLDSKTTRRLLTNNFIKLIELSMSVIKLTDKKLSLFCIRSVVFLTEIVNRIINDCIYFLQFRLILNKQSLVATLVSPEILIYKENYNAK
jgi:hypothetical protein